MVDLIISSIGERGRLGAFSVYMELTGESGEQANKAIDKIPIIIECVDENKCLNAEKRLRDAGCIFELKERAIIQQKFQTESPPKIEMKFYQF